MSFDVHFQPCRFDGTTEKKNNPFTGTVQEYPRNAPITEGEAQAVLRVVEAAGAIRQADRTYVLSLADGARCEIYGLSNLDDGCMFAIRGAGITPLLAKLLFDVLVAGNWVMLSDSAVVAASANALQGMPEDDDMFGNVVIVTSPEQIATMLKEGWCTFAAYAEKVAR